MHFKAPPGFRLATAESVDWATDQPLRIVSPDPAWRVSFVPERPLGLGWYVFEISFPPEGIVDVIAHISFSANDEFWLRVPSSSRNCFASYIRVSSPIYRMTLTISGSGYLTRIQEFSFHRLSPVSTAAKILTKLWQIATRGNFGIQSGVRALFEMVIRWRHPEVIAVAPSSSKGQLGEKPYETWIRLFDEQPDEHHTRHLERERALSRRPLISVIAIVSEDNAQLVRLAQTLTAQYYRTWELVVATQQQQVSTVREIFSQNGIERLTVLAAESQSDVATRLNMMTAHAAGEFILQLAAEICLRPNSLLELIRAVEIYPKVEIIYGDEDRIDSRGIRHEPKFKPAWSPDYFLENDYIGPTALIRRETVLGVGGWRAGLAGSHDHDLKLRIMDSVGSQNVRS